MFGRALAVALVAASAAGCAAHTARPIADSAPLEAFIEKVRQLSTEARPARNADALTLERSNPSLAAAKLLAQTVPTADNFRNLGETYARLGVLDAAYDAYTTALRLNPHDAASHDGQARIWRDWGFPDRALGVVYRAITTAPEASAPYNTLGTILVRLGQPAAARGAFSRALALDPGAAYILNNLCFAAIVERDGATAVARCQEALDADPQLEDARNNLATAYVIAGDLDSASREFLSGGDVASARYNLGMALLTTRRYRAAAAAFDEAAAVRPSLAIAAQRAKQARTLMAIADSGMQTRIPIPERRLQSPESSK